MTLTTPMRMTLTTFIKPLRAVARPAGFRFYSIGSATVPAAFQVFNRETKRHQKERAASNIEQSRQVDYVKDEVAFRVVDRLLDIKREFNEVVELGSGCGHIAKHVDTDMMKKLIMCDMSETMLNRDKDIEYEVPVERRVVDEEHLPFEENSLECVVSSLSMHWVNDLPGAMIQIQRSLKPDGVFIAGLFGGDTLFELRTSLQLAELDREGGISPRVSPMADSRDLGGLLSRAGFTLTTVDVDELTVNYPSAIELMEDLRAMGESNAVINRRGFLKRDTLMAAAAIYKEMYGNPDGTVPATFQILYMDPLECKTISFSSHATTIPVKTLTYHSVTPISSTHDTYQLSADHVSDADYEAVAKHVIEKRNANGVITTCTVPNTLAITFDDGPYRYTSELLDYLNEQDVKATFFMNGDNAGDVYEYDWVVKRAFNEGHQVASHTWSHPDLNKLSVEDIEHEMSRLDEAFKSVIGVRPVYMRPPYGNTNSVTRRTLCDMGYKIVTWSMDTNDWRHPDNVEASMKAYRSALSQPGAHKRGHIALQHDIHRTTALKLAPAAIKYAKEKGFNIVTVGECLGEPQSSWYRM